MYIGTFTRFMDVVGEHVNCTDTVFIIGGTKPYSCDTSMEFSNDGWGKFFTFFNLWNIYRQLKKIVYHHKITKWFRSTFNMAKTLAAFTQCIAILNRSVKRIFIFMNKPFTIAKCRPWEVVENSLELSMWKCRLVIIVMKWKRIASNVYANHVSIIWYH